MSRKNALTPYQLFTNADMSDDLTSAPTNIDWLDNISFHLIFTGSPVGVFYVEVSSNYKQGPDGNALIAGDWIALPIDPVPIAGGDADSIMLDLNQLGVPWVRLSYVATSGSGSLNAFVTGKAV